MAEPGFLVEKAAEILRAALPEREVVLAKKRAGGFRARVEVRGSDAVKYAYLDPGPGGTLDLRLHPGDTLTQAKRLYSDAEKVRAVLSLRDHDWEITPNFHFGYMERGLTWTSTTLDIDSYVLYWMEAIAGTGAVPRARWDEEITKLVNARIFDPSDRASFDENFVDTNREVAAPRPGISLRRSWPLTSDLSGELASQVRDAFLEAESILSERSKLVGRLGSTPGIAFGSARQIEPFEFTWPDRTTESFNRGWQIKMRFDGRDVELRHGLGRRKAYGRDRVRSVTWLREAPTVEGVEADDYPRTRCLVSALRSSDKKLIRSREDVLPGYEGLLLVDLEQEIDAPRTRHGLAVKAREDDVVAWAVHALLRSRAYGRSI